MKKSTFLMTILLFVGLVTNLNAQYFTEDFENAGAFPAGWTLTNGTYDWDIDDGTDYGPGSPQEGTYCAFFNDYDYSSGTTADMITADIDLSSATAPELKFWYYDGGGTDVVEILVATDGATYISVYTTAGTVTPWTEITIDLTAYASQSTVTIAFRGLSVWGSSNPHVDNIIVTEAPTCFPPTTLDATNITTTGADFSWVAPTLGTPLNYEWLVVISGAGSGGTAEASGTTVAPIVISNTNTLSPSTSYDFFVRTDCGAGDYSSWEGPFTFATACDAITAFPYTEDFDGGWICWQVIDNDGDTYTWNQDDTYITPHSGAWTAHGMGNNDDYLISPQFTLVAGMEMKWWDIVEDEFENNTYDVLLSTTTDDIASFTVNLGTFDCTNETWVEHTIDLSAYTGDVYIAFYQTYSAATNYGFGIDDFLLRLIPSCPDPTGLTATNILITQADLSWTEMGTAVLWNIELGTTGFSPTGTPTQSGVTNPHTYTGLTQGTSYDYYVQADCGGSTSPWVGPFTFITGSPGNDCTGPISVTAPAGLPYLDANQYTTGRGNNYDATCLGDYDGGEDIMYELVVTSDIVVDIELDAKTTTWTGMYIDDECPEISGTCIDMTTNTSSGVQGIYAISLTAGTYYIMIDTWPSPNDIPDFDLTITQITCPDPITLAVTGLTDVSADLGWTEIGSAVLWDIEFGANGFVPTGTPTQTGVSNPYNATSLTASTAYDFYVRSDCGGGDYSNWVGPFIFTTTAACPDPSDLTAINILQTSADLSWNGYFATLWDIEFGVTGFVPAGVPTQVGVTNPYNYTGLTEGISYDYYVRADCGGGTYSAWIGPFIFTTNSIGNDCTLPISVTAPAGLPYLDANQYTTGRGNNYDATCLGFYDGGEDIMYELVVTSDIVVDIVLDAKTTTYAGMYIDDECPEISGTCIDMTTNSGSGVQGIYGISLTAGTYYIMIDTWPVPNDIPDFDLTITQILCPDPTALTTANEFATSADLGWTAGGTETEWNVEVGLSGFTPGTGAEEVSILATTNNPWNATGLTVATTYEFYVQADCGGGDLSNWVGPLAFMTLCDVYTPDYLEDFTTFLPNCWDENEGPVTGPTGTPGTSGWIDDDFANGGITESAKFNLYNTGDEDWLITPEFDLSIGGYELNFDVAVTDYASTVPSAMGSDDEVQLLYTEDGTTWNNLETWNVGNTPSNTGDNLTFDISAITGTNVQFAFWANEGAVDDSEDYDFFVDNFKVRTPPTCPEPSALTATNITSNSADINWVTGGASNWNIEIDTAGFALGTGNFATISSNPFSLPPLLMPNTSYDFYVQDSCGVGDLSNWVGPFTFTTLCGTYTPDYIQDFTTFLPNCWDENEGPVSGPTGTAGTSDWYTYGFGNIGTTGAAGFNLYQIGSEDWLISPVFDLSASGYELNFDVAVTDYDNTAPSAMGSDDEVQLLYTENGTTWNNLETWNVGNTPSNTGDNLTYDISAITGTNVKFAFWAYEGIVNDIEDYEFFVDNFAVRTPLSPELTWDATTFVEDVSNDGSISTVVNLLLIDETFVISSGAMTATTHYTVANVPAGLTVLVTAIDANNATIELTGNATSHLDTDDIANMDITFLDAAFTGGVAVNVTGYSQTALVVDFMDTATIIINEVDADQVGIDANEFVELYDGGVGNSPLDGYTIVFYNGGTTDASYDAYDLDGYSTDANGYFVLGSTTVPNVTYDLGAVTNLIQNGADAVALYMDDATNFPNGTAITITNIVDALVYDTDDPDDAELLTLINTGQPQIDEAGLGDATLHSCSRLPNGTGGLLNTDTYEPAIPTPGAENMYVPVLAWDATTFTETLTNDGSIVTVVTLVLSDETFTVTSGAMTETTHYTVANVPTGLTVLVTAIDVNNATVELIGNATNHLDVDDIANMEITFLDAAFTGGVAINVIDYTQTAIIVDFFDLAPMTLVWDATTFIEDVANDGSISTVVNLVLVSETFTVTSGVMTATTHYTVANVPAGLTVLVTATDANNATIELTGNATSHLDVDDIANMEITFLDAAFSGGVAANVTGYTQTALVVDFMDPVVLTLSWDATTFVEDVANDGSISTVVNLTLNNETFATVGALTATDFSIANVPAGLTVEITTTSTTAATVTLTGNATNHANADDIANMEITFLDATFTGGVAANVTGYTQAALVVDFMDPALITDLDIVMPNVLNYSCDLTATEQVPICISNVGETVISSGEVITVYYEYPIGNVVSENITLVSDLGLTDTLCYQFTQTVDFSALGIYNISIYFYYANDEISSNDTLIGSMEHYEVSVDLGGVNDTIHVASYPTTLNAGACASPGGFTCTYLWNDASSLQTLDVSADGWYSVTVYDDNGCEGNDSVFVMLDVLVDSPVNDMGISIYPNPTNNILNVEISNNNISDIRIELINVHGQLIKELIIENNMSEINVTDFAPGVYYLKINSESNIFIEKVVIQ